MANSPFTKEQKRRLKLPAINASDVLTGSAPIDCACVIHGTAYDWTYVDRLYNMLSRHISCGINLHVYTESHRPVPAPMIKHALTDLGISGPKQSWWYKVQLFNTQHFRGPLLYFDLDTVITANIDWIWQLNLRHFWTVRDFKHLWRPNNNDSNSSVMWWNTAQYDYVWQEFNARKLPELMKQYRGDQDFITDVVPLNRRCFFDTKKVKSWRWQCLDGSYDFNHRKYHSPGSGTIIDTDTSILVFHGHPKPNKITDPVIIQHWQ